MTTTSEILNKAADLIQERGWVAGQGWPNIGARADAPLCLEGGVMAAMGMELPAGDEGLVVGEFWECPAYRAVMSYLLTDNRWGWRAKEVEDGTAHAYDWNDATGRTAAEVIEVLRAAAAIEQARENELTHNGVTYVAGAL